MTSLRGKRAVVIGASAGVGRATVRALRAEGASVTAVSRGTEALLSLRDESPDPLQTVPGDAADPALAERLLREFRPELVVLAAGVRPHMKPVDEQSWETFSTPWNADTRAAFQLVKAALTVPLAPGSSVVIVSSGAAIAGSSMSGGYPAAKRMQWLLANDAQARSTKLGLGIRFLAVLPGQLIDNTPIASAAAAAYGAQLGISGADFMKRFDEPLTVERVAAAIMGGLRGELAPGVTAVKVTPRGSEPLP